MDFHEGEWLKGEVARTKLSQLEFCRRFQLPRSTLTTWFGQRVLNPRADNMERLAEGLSRTKEQLFDDLVDARRTAAVTLAKAGKSPARKFGEIRGERLRAELAIRELPVINRIAAGPFTEKTDLDYPAGFADNYVKLALPPAIEAFGLWIDGESMMPRYEPGDLVIFRALKEGERIVEGSDYAVQREVREGVVESTFKRLTYHPARSNVIVATALNPAFSPRSAEVPMRQVVKLGHVMVIIPRSSL